MAAALLPSPLDVLKTRLQSDFYRSQPGLTRVLRCSSSPESFHFVRTSLLHFRQTFSILLSIPRMEGCRGLFRGLGPNLTSIFPATAIKFYTYGNCKRIITETMDCGSDAALVYVGATATTGMGTGTGTNPIWLVKTRLQLDRSYREKAAGRMARRYKNGLDCLIQVF